MLDGLESLAVITGFEPAVLSAEPPMFNRQKKVSAELAKAREGAYRAFAWAGDLIALGIEPLSPEQEVLREIGKGFYIQCAACHGSDGAGIPGLAPALSGADWVTGPPDWLGRIILQGMTGPVEVNGEHFNGVMPPHGHISGLDDKTLAGLMTYLRRAWGNTAFAVSPERAASIRANSLQRQQSWTVEELQNVYIDRGFDRLVGDYAIGFYTITISEKPSGLHMEESAGGGRLLTQVGDLLFSVDGDRIEFASDDSGAITELIIRQGGKAFVSNASGDTGLDSGLAMSWRMR